MKNYELFTALQILHAHMNDETQIVKIPRAEAIRLLDIITKAMWDVRKTEIINNMKREFDFDYLREFGFSDDEIIEIYELGDDE